VFYSREGSTAQIARGLAQATGGTLRKLVDSRRMENGGMFRALIATALGLGTTLVDPEYTVEPFEAVVVMTPVWIGNPAPAVTTFINNTVLKGKKTFIVAVGGTAANPRTIAKLEKRLTAHGASVAGHSEVLGYVPDSRAVRPSDEELMAEGALLAETVRQAFKPQS
jgi:menaquinone-dependent protoporphyrinogen IX oxidase